MENLIHLRWLDLGHNAVSEEDLLIICRLYFLQTLDLSNCSFEKVPKEIGNLVELRHLNLESNKLKELPSEIGNLVELRHLNLASNELKELPSEIGNLVELRNLNLCFDKELKELPESMCNLVELRILNLNLCRTLVGLPDGIHRLRNLKSLLLIHTPASRLLPQGLGELSGLRTLGAVFYGGSGWNKLGLLKKLNGLRESLELEINFTSSSSDFEELVKDAQEADLRSKDHIHTLEIIFKKDEAAGSSSSLSSSSLWMDMMEALEPNLKKLNKLLIGRYRGSGLPEWISSPLSLVKNITLYDSNELSSLPPFGRLPCLEHLSMSFVYELKCSSSTKQVVNAFPKLKRLSIKSFRGCLEWEDITAEEEESSFVSIMPCLEKLNITSCKDLKKLPHRLLRKASSSLRILNIEDSSLLLSQYEDRDGSQWSSISQNNPQLELSY